MTAQQIFETIPLEIRTQTNVIASQFMPVIIALRDKDKLPWFDVMQWFQRKGYNFSQGGITSAYQKMQAKRAEAALPATGIEAEVCADIAARQRAGIAKYKMTVADNPAKIKEWMEHAYLEFLDGAIYLKRAMRDLRG